MYDPDGLVKKLEGYQNYLKRLREYFPNPQSIPAIVWAVAESDANAPIVWTTDRFERDDYIDFTDGDAFGLTWRELRDIRDVIRRIYFVRSDDPNRDDRIDGFQIDLWQLCEQELAAEPSSDLPFTQPTDTASEPPTPLLADAGPMPWGEKGVGLQSRKQWCLELAACKAFGRSAASVVRLGGGIYEPHVDIKTGTFFLGSSTVEKMTGLAKKSVDEWRKQLVDNGWLRDTGKRQGRAIVWELRLPDCDCGNHGRYVRRSLDDNGGSDTPHVP